MTEMAGWVSPKYARLKKIVHNNFCGLIFSAKNMLESGWTKFGFFYC